MEPFNAVRLEHSVAVGFDVRNIRELYHSSQVMRVGVRQNIKQLNVLKASRKKPVFHVPHDSLDQFQRLEDLSNSQSVPCIIVLIGL